MTVEQFLKQFEGINPDTEMEEILIYKNKILYKTEVNFVRFKCSDKIPVKPGIYLGYEQYDPTDRYLVEWNGGEWLNINSGNSICFGSETREDYWSEIPESFNE